MVLAQYYTLIRFGHAGYTDIAEARETLEKKGGASEKERRQVKTGVGY